MQAPSVSSLLSAQSASDRSDDTTLSCGQNCSSVSSGGFACSDGIQCINESWRCDGEAHCQDGSDETEKECKKDCPSEYFRCSSGQCIKQSYKCDGEHDCKDGSDIVPSGVMGCASAALGWWAVGRREIQTYLNFLHYAVCCCRLGRFRIKTCILGFRCDKSCRKEVENWRLQVRNDHATALVANVSETEIASSSLS